CDALLLAYAGVARMEYHELIRQELSLDIFTPAVGQGSLAVEIATSLSIEKKSRIREIINDPQTEIKLKAERAYLRKLKGGCSIPAFANAQINARLPARQGNRIVLQAGIFSLDGREFVNKTAEGGLEEPETLGKKLGEDILNEGGAEILDQINKELKR
ncbi:MAG: hydroxymethylbilane synthase, partial [Cyclobacteriaceae bacterium]|nr:hydroxymethylbilane synthase [Cyclobacteriaceae bacterium]